jgi:predicted MFS family arabinose efflux permease
MVASLLVGVTTVAPQLIIPLAASMAAPYERGRVVGMVMSGVLIGILLARTVSGIIAAHLGWRAVYWIAAGIMLMLAVLMRFTLPLDRPRSAMSYKELLRSLVPLLREEPVLRETSFFGAMSFGAFSVFWVTLGFFLETPPYHYGSAVVGTFGLVGVVGATAATFAGRLADRIDARRVIGVTMLITLISFVLMGLTGQWLWGLVLGVILLDLGVQGTQVSNQARIYSLNPAARNRLNTIYMVTYFIGGSLGSYLGVLGWSIAKWWGVCGVAALMMLVALSFYVFNRQRRAALA